MKLVEILARELEEWPNGAEEIGQWPGGEVAIRNTRGAARTLFSSAILATDHDTAWCTENDWQAARAAYLASIQPERDAEIAKVVGGTKKLPYAFTEADIRAAFAAGANWVRGAIEDGAAEYVEKLKGHK